MMTLASPADVAVSRERIHANLPGTAMIWIGTAGWAIPRAVTDRFAATGTSLARYAGRFGAAEINSSFHRPHRPDTYTRWAESVPERFRFSAKLPRSITHDKRLVSAEAELTDFLQQASHLGPKLGPLLVQLPPSLAFDPVTAKEFFGLMRGHTDGLVACEPRHASWFDAEANAFLAEFHVARVAADPARVPEAAVPGGWAGLRYYRLHGSPHIYRSEYSREYLSGLATELCGSPAPEAWCVFDNTTSGAATGNALTLSEEVAARKASR